MSNKKVEEPQKILEPQVEQIEGEMAHVTFSVKYPDYDEEGNIDEALAKYDAKLFRTVADWIEGNPKRAIDTVLFCHARGEFGDGCEAILSLIVPSVTNCKTIIKCKIGHCLVKGSKYVAGDGPWRNLHQCPICGGPLDDK